MPSKSSGIAYSNIALVKYWGRSQNYDPTLNIPSNDSVSMTKYGLDPHMHLQTRTTVEFSDSYEKDVAILEGEVLRGKKMNRVLRVVNSLRRCVNTEDRFRMMSKNDFPTQAGLASSASGFAALAIATVDALSINFSREKISTYARLGSGSAARSIHGGFVYWHRGNSHETSYTQKICGSKEFEMNTVIAIVYEGKKDVSSDVGHESAHTSPFNQVRIKESQKHAEEIKEAILNDDFTKVGTIAEKNSKYMHIVMMTSDPPLFYWRPDTLRIIKSVQGIRQRGLECYFTVDAGPNVHLLCRPEDSYELQKALEEMRFIKKTLPARPAEDPHVLDEHLF